MNDWQPDREGVFFGLPSETYHKAPGVSQSTLKRFMAEPTPLHFREAAARPRRVTPEMEFGTVVHATILEGDDAGYHVRPDTYPCKPTAKDPRTEKPWSMKADWCKDWMEAHADRIVITREQVEWLPIIRQRVAGLGVFSALLRRGDREVSYFRRDERTGLLCKCRVDSICTDDDGVTWIVDVKTVFRGGADTSEFSKSCHALGYHIQAASYLSITGASRFIFVAVEHEPPFEAQVFELDGRSLSLGLESYKQALSNYADCVARDEWPGYDHELKELTLPHWAFPKRAFIA